MADLMDLLQSQIGGSLVDQIAGQLGGAPKEKTNEAVGGAMTLLMEALANNASTPQGASALNSALDRDHDGSILDDISGFLGGQKQARNTSMLNGAGILHHVLGQRKDTAVDMLSQKTGMDKSQIFSMLVQVAPVVMGMLGKVKKQQNLDDKGIQQFLRTSNQVNQAKNKGAAGIFTQLLDKDGDGSVMDDVASSGFKAILGRLFKRR